MNTNTVFEYSLNLPVTVKGLQAKGVITGRREMLHSCINYLVEGWHDNRRFYEWCNPWEIEVNQLSSASDK